MELATLHQLFLQSAGVTTDTRSIPENSLFFALKGERFNGNTFALEALEQGASWAIVDELTVAHERLILVEDVLTTLQDLARFHRQYLGIPIIALTGSNGKTTTKELIHAVVKQKFQAVATIGNLNNHIGVPLTLLRMNESTEIGIVEMGANHQQEIAQLCSIALPDYGYITNFGKAHLEGFGGYEGVIKGKSEMYDYLLAYDKVAFVCADDPIQLEKTQSIKRLTFGKATDAAVQIEDLQADPYVTFTAMGQKITMQLTGIYNGINAAAAFTIGHYLEIDTATIKAALEGYLPTNNRSQWMSRSSYRLLLDAYNANPSSMLLALESFAKLEAKGKTVFIGDMFELGEAAQQEHTSILAWLKAHPSIHAIAIGAHFAASASDVKADNIVVFSDYDSAAAYARQLDLTDQMVLIKGSRGMALERLLDVLPA